ncbi:uncharacterized protein LOC135204186 [Macrobrachium nipponense]|uniref:uncharacterized protein LOC135204186 n=1 Tax=Macrobrachium nipponense TaxID=159736 RepID=UPI0030C88024
MSDLPDAGEDLPPRSRSLRVRQARVDYSEDEFEEDSKKISQKKRGSKRKAEVNIESLYCQENAKDVCVCPSLLETIFESPIKGLNRIRNKNVRAPGRVSETGPELQMMSVKKWKRFCAFADYYHPSKQKVKVRKDRAKKMKQLTGVKVPKGMVSDDALKTVLAVLSDEEDQPENTQNTSLCKSSSDFYVGNIIRPDSEDSSLNDVIRNISSLKMVTDRSDERHLSPNALMEGMDEPLLFADEKQNILPAVSHQKKSRRRSEKFSGILLPRSVKRIDEESEALSHGDSGVKAMGSARIMIEENSEWFEQDEMKEVKTTPKRRNVLSDKKVVKKPKHHELTLKRQSESKDDQCQKKRGDVKLNVTKFNSNIQVHEHDTENNFSKKRNTIKFDVENSFGIASILPCNEISLTQQYSDLRFEANKQNKSGVGRKPGKRRVSGVQRPLYRKLIEPQTPEVLKSQNQSPNNSSSSSSSPLLCFNNADEQVIENSTKFAEHDIVQQNTLKTSCSPTSPCTQMAALSLQSERDMEFHLAKNNLKHETSRRVTRRSMQLTKLPLSKNPSSPLSTRVPNCSDNDGRAGCSSSYNSDVPVHRDDHLQGGSEGCKLSQEVLCDNISKSSNIHSHSDQKKEVVLGVIPGKKVTVKRHSDCNVGLIVTKGSNCISDQRAESASKTCVTNDCFPENAPTYLSPCKENIALNMLNIRGQVTPQIFENGSVNVATSRATPEISKCSLDMKRPENVKVGESCETKIANKVLCLEDEDFDSPIITGMIGNKANIKCGKIYRNRLSTAESPIILAQLAKHKSKESILN